MRAGTGSELAHSQSRLTLLRRFRRKKFVDVLDVERKCMRRESMLMVTWVEETLQVTGQHAY